MSGILRVPPPPPPPAETGEWSATLTTGTVSNLVGCDEELAAFPTIAACSDAITSDQFIHAGTTYSIIGLRYNISDYSLELKIVPALTGTAKHYLTFVVGGTPLAFGDAVKEDGAAYSTRVWNNPGFNWSPGQSVSLRLEPKPWLPEGELGATSVFAKRYRAGNVKITWNDITINGVPLPPGQPDYAVTVSGGRRDTTWALSHLETVIGDPLGRGNRYTVEHPTSTSDNNNQSDHDVAFTYTLKVIGDEWLASGKTFLRIDCPAVGSANVVDCGLSTAPSALRALNASAYESYGPMQFRVEVDPAASGRVTVDYATADRTSGTKRALAGQDYYATSGTLTFAPGETAKFVVVGIIDDAVRDDNETFYLNLSNAVGATISDGQATGEITNTEPLTASFEGVPEAHDGQSAFSVRVAFSEDIGISYQTLRDESFTTTGGAVTGARRVDGRHDLWEITVEPSGAEDVTITLPRGRDCGTTGAVCTREDTPRALTNTPSATVKGPSASEGDPPSDPPDPSDPLTASFSGVPGEHTGERFTFGLTFSEDVAGLSFKTLRDAAFAVTGGDVRKAQRKQQGSSQGWTITVEPSGNEAVSIRLPAGSVETSDGRGLESSVSATVNGPAGIAVADARVDENTHAALAFAVTLDRAASGTVTVDYATSNGTATAGADYTATSGTLRFAAGEQSKSVSVAVLDDDHDEGEETVTLTLSNASGARITDGTATGTIKNRDPLPRALLARFGRTAAVHVVEHVEERIAAPRAPGVEGRFAGRELRPGMEREIALNVLSQLGASVGGNPVGAGVHDPRAGAPTAGVAALGTPGRAGGGVGMATMTGPMDARAGSDRGLTGRGLFDMGLGGGDVLTGSAVAVNRETHGGILSFWSRGAQSHFSGREGALSLGGDVRTTMVGADYAKGPLVAGLSLSHSRGLGEYVGVTGGQVASSVTGLYPWLGYQVTDRVSVWGVTGYGAGGLLLTPNGGPALRSGLSMAMAAAGTRGELVAGGAGGFALAFKADALWVGTSIDGVDGAAGRLAATDAAVSRFRTGLEGSRAYTLAGRLSLRPSVEVGLRHDGGDAETGAGMDVGAGLVMADAATGLAVDVRVRTLPGASGRGIPRAGPRGVTELQPDAVDAAGADGAGGAVLGRAGAERGRGAVGPRDDGGDGARRRRRRHPARRGGRLRAAGRQPLRRDAHGRRRNLRLRAGLPAGLPPRRARRCGDDGRVWRRCAAAGEPPGGRHGSRRARAGHGGLVTAARSRAQTPSTVRAPDGRPHGSARPITASCGACRCAGRPGSGAQRVHGAPLRHPRLLPADAECSAPGFLDSGLTVFASTLPLPARRGHVAPGRGFDSGTAPASTARCTSA